MKRALILLALPLLIGGAIAILFLLHWENVELQEPPPGESDAPGQVKVDHETISALAGVAQGPDTASFIDAMTNGISTQLSGPFQISLETRENIDYILTPGILVRQAIEEDDVPVYPAE